jgi:hypothetical protein
VLGLKRSLSQANLQGFVLDLKLFVVVIGRFFVVVVKWVCFLLTQKLVLCLSEFYLENKLVLK